MITFHQTIGHYKLRRSKFIGLYQNKSISYIAEIVGKVTFRTEKSKGFVWWNNIGEMKMI